MGLVRCCWVVLMLMAGGGLAHAAAQEPATLAEQAAKRFPQAVRVGDLIGRDVLQPTEAQPVLGRVMGVVRRVDGGLDVVVSFGGVLGIGARPIAVPVDAVALLGEHVAIVGFTPEALRGFPSAVAVGAAALAPGDMIRVGLVRPFH